MKIIPEQSTSLMTHSSPRFRVDTWACCFFILGMFLSAVILHLVGIFPTSI
ncbi:hypothetical protein [Acinetobacter shaoyimingii]|uniref:Uncharacterized protein n=1 Tax=Acinetobacter shaoyimingii TaxID=2715164 RepID=A0A6G8RX17_9GAMM|nr:hypothetical protein [Acinetobacter shaoyimingii]NHB57887.1 hypothetical protein [Acinetobacter shaoyimingii]QIO06486.1 hypothetical protein G8E00_11245 [Acinetobacter shaoyimingii]